MTRVYFGVLQALCAGFGFFVVCSKKCFRGCLALFSTIMGCVADF